MKKILLDTNMFIYLEDNKVIDEKVATLTKRLYDSTEYKIVIHPKTKVEASKCTDVEIKKIFLSLKSCALKNNTSKYLFLIACYN